MSDDPNGGGASGPGSLSATEAEELDRACDLFAAAWRAGGRPDLARHLTEAGEAGRAALVRELVAIDAYWRRRIGELPSLEEYLGRFPDDAVAVAAAIGPQAPSLGSFAAERLTFTDYEILGELGRGGMGVVYRAFDRGRREMVALKIMHRADPAALLLFKREFRSLADVAHPNLVSLYELKSDARGWFFTMELVDGVDFLTYLRSDTDDAESDTIPDATSPEASLASPVLPETAIDDGEVRSGAGPAVPTRSETGARPRRGLSPSQVDRLRAVLRQLAEGLAALHAADRLHRDLKPSNVLVTRRGRVVILDFGLATELGQTGLHLSSEPHLMGTVAYMAPEQAASLPVSPASDWYSVGVMLFQALTGSLPFLGAPLEILMDKQRVDPPNPRQLLSEVPDDLDSLCADLLRRDPGARPTSRDVLSRLGRLPADSEVLAPPRSSSQPPMALIGREQHMDGLAKAYAAVQGGRPVALYIHGRSGAGKTALVRQFLDGVGKSDRAVILKGRCYEREAMPYKALDELVDAVGRYLKHVPAHDVRGLLPRDVGPLVRVFPALRQVEAIEAAPRRATEVPDPQERRRRAFAALRDLLGRVGDTGPLVLFIDDLQWGDIDSAAMLTQLLGPPDPPVLLLLGAYRSEDAATSPCLRELLGARDGMDAGLDRREVVVDALSPPEALALALRLLGREGPETDDHARAIARESGGNPFFVAELVRHVQSGIEPAPRTPAGGGSTLDQALWTRAMRLPEGARRLLEVIAVSGRPLDQAAACEAAGLDAQGRAMLGVLRTGRLIRGTGSAESAEVETYHDRVREAVLAHLPSAAHANHHRRLAAVLELAGRAAPEVLAVHFDGAGEPLRAAEYYATAADRAAEALAFDRAATLYRLALGLVAAGGEPERLLRARLGDTLSNAGRGAQAAREYLAVAAGATVAEALELKRRAAMQYLISGHIDEGLAALRTVLAAVGMRLPSTPRGAFALLLLRRLQIRLRGIEFRRRDASQVSAEILHRLDILRSVSDGLGMVDPICAAAFQTHHLLLALRTGEPYRIARALALETAHVSTAGRPSRRRTAKLMHATEVLAEQVEHPDVPGMVLFVKGVAAYCEGRWAESLESCELAETVFRNRCTGVTWELDTTQTFALWSMTYLGEIAALNRRLSILLNEANERGDLYAIINMSTYIASLLRLGQDDPEGAERELLWAMGQWSGHGFHVQHHNGVLARVYIELYRGNGEVAWEHVCKQLPNYTKSFLIRVQQVRIDILQLHARCALAAAGRAANPRPLMRAAEQDARRLLREKLPWSDAHAAFIRASIMQAHGKTNQAVELLSSAANQYESCEMLLYSASTRRRLGELVGGEAGRDLVSKADCWMSSQLIRNPGRFAAMYATGATDRG